MFTDDVEFQTLLTTHIRSRPMPKKQVPAITIPEFVEFANENKWKMPGSVIESGGIVDIQKKKGSGTKQKKIYRAIEDEFKKTFSHDKDTIKKFEDFIKPLRPKFNNSKGKAKASSEYNGTTVVKSSIQGTLAIAVARFFNFDRTDVVGPNTVPDADGKLKTVRGYKPLDCDVVYDYKSQTITIKNPRVSKSN